MGGADAEGLAELGHGMLRAGLTGMGIAGDIAERHNMDVVRETMSSAEQELNGFATQEFQKQGRDALGASGRIRDFGQKIAKDRIKALNGPQQEIFNRVWSQYADQHVLRAQGFEAREADVYHKQTLEQANLARLESMRIGMNDPKAIEAGLAEIGANTRAIHSGSADVDLRVKVAKEATMANLIQQRAVSDPAAALVFLETHQARLNPGWALAERSRLQGLVDDLRVNGQVMALSSAPGATLQSAIDAVDKRTDLSSNEKAKTMEGLRTQFAIRDHAATQARQQASEGAWDAMWKAPTLDTVARLQVPEAEKVKMRDALARMNEKRSDEDQAAAYGRLLGDPNLQQINLLEHRTEVSAGQFDHLWDLQQKMRKGGTKETDNFKQAVAYAKGMMADSKYFKKEETKQAQMLAAFHQRLRFMPDADRADFSKVKSVFDDLMTQAVIEKRSLFGIDWLWPDKMAEKFRIETGEVAVPENLSPSQPVTGMVPITTRRTLSTSGAPSPLQETSSTAVSPAPPISRFADTPSAAVPDSIVDFVKEHEGFSSTAYGDGKQHSIGWGSVATGPDEAISEKDADVRLRQELGQSYFRIMRAAEAKGWPITESQAKALVSFDYNTGAGLKVLNDAKGWRDVRLRMARYVKIGDRQSRGLAKRRSDEISLIGD
jgi:GH24 family phage-related lysozyme (muramidase)